MASVEIAGAPSAWAEGVLRLTTAPASGDATASTAWHGRYVGALVLADGVVVALSLLGSHVVGLEALGAAEGRTGPHLLLLSLLITPLWVLSLALNGAYDHHLVGTGAEEYRRVFDASMRFAAGLALAALALEVEVGRGFVAMALTTATASTVASHHIGSLWLRRRRSAGRCMYRVLVAGEESQVSDLVRRIRGSGDGGLAVVGACVPGWHEGQQLRVDGEPVRVLGAPADVLDPRRLTAFDSVAVADHEGAGDIRALLRGSGVDLLMVPTVTPVRSRRIQVVPVDGLPLLHLRDGGESRCIWLLEQSMQRVLAGVLLLAALPALLVAAAAVRLTSSGPALFAQVRLGKGGRPFTIWKLRTMQVSAEAGRDCIIHLNERDGPLFKIRRDPRVTPVGRFLRRLSIDELPQLWNVLRGDMSLVGPRPPLPGEVEQYSNVVGRRLLVKPGLTGLWQVSGRSDLPWQEGIELDLHYVDNRSLTGDLAILCKTVAAVVRGKGAY